jgi:hypothetical protein
MSSFHKVPYCWGKLKYTQDDIHNLGSIICPHCKITITNQDVVDSLLLVDLISLIKAAGSKQTNLFEGIK